VGSPSALRKLNDQAALYALLESGPLSRHEVELAAGVSTPAAAELLRRLEESGLARRAGHRPGGRGPQAQLWAVNERAAFAAGLDVSESGIDAVIADLGGEPLGECQIVPAPDEDPALAVRRALTQAARRAGLRRADVRHVAVGISGAVDPATGILNHADHIPEWNGFDVEARLAQVLGVPVAVENDVKLVLSDESIRGQAQGCKDVLLLWMGRGIALAAIVGGQLQRGFHGSAGELNEVPLGPGGPLAGSVLALPGALDLARSHGIRTTDAVRTLHKAGAEPRDAAHEAFLAAFAGRIVDLLAAPVALLDPELVILGGDLGLAGGDELAERVKQRMHALLAHRPRVVTGTGSDNSVRQGAVDEALRRLRSDVFSNTRNLETPVRQRWRTAAGEGLQ